MPEHSVKLPLCLPGLDIAQSISVFFPDIWILDVLMSWFHPVEPGLSASAPGHLADLAVIVAKLCHLYLNIGKNKDI